MNAHSFLNRVSLITAACMIVFPFLHFYSVNYANEFFSDWFFLKFSFISVCVLGLLLGAAVFVGSGLLRVPIYRIAALFSTALVLFFLFKPIQGVALTGLMLLGAPRGATLAYAAVLLIALVGVWWLAKWKTFHLAAVIFAAVMVGWSAARLASASATTLTRAETSETVVKTEPRPILDEGQAPGSLRNIYYVIADGYASLDVLKDFMNFEDDAIRRLSTEYGYTQIRNAVSSYTVTNLTLASIFLGDYPVVERTPRYTNFSDFYPNVLMKEKPPATIAAARRLGYDFYLVGNIWHYCKGNHVRCLDDGARQLAMPYELRLFVEPTPIAWLVNRYGRLLKVVEPSISGVDSVGRVLEQFRGGKMPVGPFFMFVHHLPPHPPYVFEADCSLQPSFSFDLLDGSKSAQPLYLANLQCANRRLLDLAAYLTEHDPEAIVVFQADHGSHLTVNWRAPIDDWKDESVRERTSIFSFIRAPEACRDWLRPNLNSVNTVRFVLGCAAGQEPRFVANESYIAIYDRDAADYGKVYRVRRKRQWPASLKRVHVD